MTLDYDYGEQAANMCGCADMFDAGFFGVGLLAVVVFIMTLFVYATRRNEQ